MAVVVNIGLAAAQVISGVMSGIAEARHTLPAKALLKITFLAWKAMHRPADVGDLVFGWGCGL